MLRREVDMRGVPMGPLAVPVAMAGRRRADMPPRGVAMRGVLLPVEAPQQCAGADRDQPAVALADR